MLRETTTPTGIKMQVLKEGTGTRPSLGDTVISHYIVNLGDGASTSEYDYEKEEYLDSLVESTYEEKPFSGPVEFVLGKRTPDDDVYSAGDSLEGLDEAFINMKVGEKRRLFIPANLAYGELGASSFHSFHGYRAPPNANLDIIVEIVDIKKNIEEK
tara:strand:+ start:3749 stop:4219 length:471 start_codon:yes stop_codon:yes gene_type:complete